MFRQIRTIAFYTLLEALRNRLIWLFVAIALAGIGLSGFLNELAITESRQIQLAVLAAFVRFAAVFVLATFIVTSMAREFNDKGIDLLLALPLSRASYLFGKLVGVAALALVPAVLFGTLAVFFSPVLQSALWTISLLFELWIVAAFCLLCVLTFAHVMGSLTTVLAFYLLARSMTAFQLIAHGPHNGDALSQKIIGLVIDAVAALLPRLDEFTRTDWLVYHTGTWSSLGPLLTQSAIFLALIVGASLFDLYRKNI